MSVALDLMAVFVSSTTFFHYFFCLPSWCMCLHKFTHKVTGSFGVYCMQRSDRAEEWVNQQATGAFRIDSCCRMRRWFGCCFVAVVALRLMLPLRLLPAEDAGLVTAWVAIDPPHRGSSGSAARSLLLPRRAAAAWNAGDAVTVVVDHGRNGATATTAKNPTGSCGRTGDGAGTRCSCRPRTRRSSADRPGCGCGAAGGTTAADGAAADAASSSAAAVRGSTAQRKILRLRSIRPSPPLRISTTCCVPPRSEKVEDDDSDDERTRRQLAHFATLERWVVFSDLHCSPATLETCLHVLREVHRTAVERAAGIVFLGDFWHVRGTLRVDCLNAVRETLAAFERPMILIPGNHDQVRLSGGRDHALMPLQHAYRVGAGDGGGGASVPGLLVLSHPTTFLKALWIPHLKRGLDSVLRQHSHQSAIFCHADVSGASMNDNIVSQGGISPAQFPRTVPVYTGHFHKPHTVRGNIHYVGSPYQVSLAEARQDKYLWVLDATQNWTCVDRIPLFAGRRHFRPTALREFLDLAPVVDDNNNSTAAVRAGDRVVFSIGQREAEGLRRRQASNMTAPRMSWTRTFPHCARPACEWRSARSPRRSNHLPWKPMRTPSTCPRRPFGPLFWSSRCTAASFRMPRATSC